MKRKLWITLALAVLIAALGCVSVLAEWGDTKIPLIYSYPQSLTMETDVPTTVRVTMYGDYSDFIYNWYVLKTDSILEYLEDDGVIPDSNSLSEMLVDWSEVRKHAQITTVSNWEMTIIPTDDFLDDKFLLCVVEEYDWTYISEAGYAHPYWDCTAAIPLTVESGHPYITRQPEGQTATVGSTAVYRIDGEQSYSYQYFWYVCDENHMNIPWSTVQLHASYTGHLTKELSITPNDMWLNGKYVYCLVKNRFGAAAYSDYAMINVNEKTSMMDYIECPDLLYLHEDQTYLFVIHSQTATEYSWSLNYSWAVEIAYNTDGNTLYLRPTNIDSTYTGVTHYPLKITCLLRDAKGNEETVTIDNYILTNDESGYTILSSPDSYVSANVGQVIEARLDVVNGKRYDWYVCDPYFSTSLADNSFIYGAYGWDEVREHAEVSGLGTSCLTLRPTDNWLSGKVVVYRINADWRNYYMYITITNDKPSINNQGSVSIVSLGGTNAANDTFTARLDGNLNNLTEHLTYQWQYLTAGESQWQDIGSPEKQGVFNGSANYSGKFLRVRVTADNMDGTLYSGAIRLLSPRLSGDVTVTAPGGEPVRRGDTLHADMENTTAALVFQWQRSSDNETFTDIQDAVGRNYVTVAADVGCYVRAKVTANGYSGQVYSNGVYVEPMLCTVSFEMNDHGAQIADQFVLEGQTATRPQTPTAEGYLFVNWYTNAACTKVFTFSTPITEDTVIYLR